MEQFCTHCGGRLVTALRDGRERLVCSACQRTVYRNAKIIAGTIPMHNGQVLLCRRANAPQCGLWTLPAGYLETDETSPQGAARETREEAGAMVRISRLYNIIELPHLSQLHLFYLAELNHADYQAGPETSEVRFFPLAAIPWDAIAFGTVRETLKRLAAEWPHPVPHHMEIQAHSHSGVDQLIEYPLCGNPVEAS
jgi:ADP-ribose pyrophosphatase YjhB (NUDIX family)